MATGLISRLCLGLLFTVNKVASKANQGDGTTFQTLPASHCMYGIKQAGKEDPHLDSVFPYLYKRRGGCSYLLQLAECSISQRPVRKTNKQIKKKLGILTGDFI